jgi:glycosyltransferase involved in cell wall biosynthesis
LTWLVKRLYNRAYRIVVPSKLSGQDLVRNFNVQPGKISVIYNYVDGERVGRLAEEPIADPFLQRLFEHPILLNVGRITRAKGQWLLPLLFSRLKNSLPGWRLVILGEPEEGGVARQRLTELAVEAGLSLYDNSDPNAGEAGAREVSAADLQHDIYLIGFRKNPFQFMRRSRILWFPSLFEGFPNIVIESMQCGLPVITADCHSGPREIMAPDTDPAFTTDSAEITPYGILAPPLTDDLSSIDEHLIDEWVKATRLLISDEDRRSEIIANGYRRLHDFSREQALRGWEEIITG